jgi:hypothetical protein
MLRHVALVRTNVSEEPSASFMRVTIIGELGTTLAVTSNRRTLYFFAACVCCYLQLALYLVHRHDEGAKFLRNVGSYKSHTA